jgi:tetratricopeptide (TPR) repeat protein
VEASAPARPAAPERGRKLGGKRVVLEYDPHPTSAAPPPATAPTPLGEDPQVVARARDAYHSGNLKLFAGDTTGAETAYRDALRIYPGYVAGYRGLGLAYAQQGNRDAALNALRLYLRTVPGARDAELIKRRIERLEKGL